MSDVLNEGFHHIRNLKRDFDRRFDTASTSDEALLNEIAGMFAVTIVATYEGVVKNTLISYADRCHSDYGNFIAMDFEKSNARVKIEHLKGYAKKFGIRAWHPPKASKVSTIFDEQLRNTRTVVERRFRRDMSQSYQNLFDWRNDYAHERKSTATLEDVYRSHQVGQYVVRTFVKTFETNSIL